MTSVLEIILLLSIAMPITQYDTMILDEYQYNESNNNISINRNYEQQDFFLKDEKSPVQVINVISNTLQRFFAFSDVSGENIIKYTIALLL